MLGETTVFVYSAGKLVAEYSTQLSQTPSVAYTTTDHLGTPRVITDQFGQVKARRDFMPFGEELYTGVGGRTGDTGLKYSSNQDDIRQKFTGYQKDNETGPDCDEARMYENRLGRFTAVDPLLASGRSTNPQTFNRYVYTSNNPIDRIDPDGKDWVRVKHVRVTRSGRSYNTYQPVWKEKAYGAERWKEAVYRITHGKNRGKWAALDPWNDRWTLADTRAGAVAAYEGYRSQMKTDVIAGAVQPAVDLANVAEVVATRGASLTTGQDGIGTKIRDAGFGLAGATPDESSGPFRSAANMSSLVAGVGSGTGALTSSGSLTLTAIRAEHGFTRVFRAVSAAELDDIGSFGFRSNPTGRGYQEVKLFAETASDAAQFGRNNFRLDNVPNFIVSGDVPNSVLESSYRFSDVGLPAVSIPAQDLRLIRNVRTYNYSPYRSGQ